MHFKKDYVECILRLTRPNRPPVRNFKSFNHSWQIWHGFIWDALRDLVQFVQFKKRENTHGRVLLLLKFLAEACHVTESSNLPLVFVIFFKLYKWYQIARSIKYNSNISLLLLLYFAKLPTASLKPFIERREVLKT